MNGIKIGKKVIKRDSSDLYIIAEAGVNHECSIDLAKKMISMAAEAGADAIKFQTYKAEKLASINSPAYWDQTKEKAKSQYELFKKYDAFNYEDYRILADYCSEHNIDFLSTPFDKESVQFLNELMPVFKIASADLTNHPFLREIARFGKPIILSTGASTLGEIDEAVNVIISEGNSQIALLHCILSYPTKVEDANLNMITHLQEVYPDFVVGYSDHVVPDKSMMVLNTAVFLGAKIIEKHFTLNKTKEGNDHYHAMDSEDLKVFVENIRIYRAALGCKTKVPILAEKDAIKYARRSIVAKRNIVKGTILTEKMLTTKRPGIGIPPKYWEIVIGREAKTDIKEDDILTWEMV